MHILKKSHNALALVVMLIGMSAMSASSADGQFGADRHMSRGVGCSGCHKESPPKTAVTTDACLKCHGDYDKLALRTKKIIPNPHEHHNGDLPCEACHHAHKPSEIQCEACHSFSLSPK